MATLQPQPDGPAVDINVEKHGDVDVGVHILPDASAHDEKDKPAAVDDEHKMETQRQAWFENAIKEKLKIPNSYEEVSVLMIRWAPDIDDYHEGTHHEIKELKRVFEQRFGFSVAAVVSLDPAKAKPQNALNCAIAQHILKHDGANKLMIIYYTGHGAIVGPKNRLAFAPTASAAKELMKNPHSVAYWDDAEKQLLGENVEPDVLTILDCCFASSGHKGCNNSRRTYDLLAACGEDEETPAPGEGSFTQRLITTLDRLLNEEGDQRILTTRLVEELNKDGETQSRLFDRLKKDDGRVVQLKALTKKSKEETKKRAINFRKKPQEEAGVSLRFSLQDQNLSKKKIEDWAKALIHACKSVGVPLRRIDWVKMEKNNPGERLRQLVDIVNEHKKISNSPRRRFQQAIRAVIADNRNRSRRVNKRARSKEPSPVTPKRRTSDKLLTPTTRSTSRLLTPESNSGEHHNG